MSDGTSQTSPAGGPLALFDLLVVRPLSSMILSVVLGIVVWIYLGFVIATTEVPTDQGTLTPFGA